MCSIYARKYSSLLDYIKHVTKTARGVDLILLVSDSDLEDSSSKPFWTLDLKLAGFGLDLDLQAAGLRLN
jgi:hypothetical protein